jgi:hypothetical protein
VVRAEPKCHFTMSGGILRSLPSLSRDPSKEPPRAPFDMLRMLTPTNRYDDSSPLHPNEVTLRAIPARLDFWRVST